MSIQHFHKQQSIKYASLERALSIALPSTARVIQDMVAGSDRDPIIDIKWWPWLLEGDIPGVPGWHYDIWNDPIKGAKDRHKIFILGAGCRTEFLHGKIDEGVIFEYTGADLHRISPVTKPGPRILIRCSWTTLKPKNQQLRQGHIAQ